MNSAELMDYINQKYHPERWTVGGIQIWVRTKVSLICQIEAGLGTTQPGKTKNSYLYRILRAIYRVPKRLVFQLSNFRLSLLQKSQNDMRDEAIVMVGYNHLRNFLLSNGQYYHVYMDPITDMCEKAGYKVKFFEHRIMPGRLRTPQYSTSIIPSFNWFIHVLSLRIKAHLLGHSLMPVTLEGYEDFRKDLQDMGYDGNLLPSHRQLEILAIETLFYKRYFLKHINLQTCRLGLCVDGHSPYMEGFVLACKDMGIPVAELQHGVIGYDHPAFAYWDADQPYENLPDYYICWDEASADSIRAWSNKVSWCQVLVAGNPWHAVLMDRFSPIINMSIDKYHALFKQLMRDKAALLSLQGDMVRIGESFLETIEATPNLLWIVRLHPTTSAREYARIQRTYGRYRNVFIDDGVEIPAVAWYPCVDYHVTLSSTIALEVAWWGIPTISVDTTEYVLGMYPQLVKNKFLFVAHAKEEFLKLLDSVNKRTPLEQFTCERYMHLLESIMKR